MRTELQNSTLRTVFGAVEKLSPLRVEGMEYIQEVKEMQREAIEITNVPLPMVVAFNHTPRTIDPFRLTKFIHTQFGDLRSDIILIGADRYMSYTKSPINATVFTLARAGGLIFYPVMQPYRLRDYGLTKDEKAELMRTSRELSDAMTLDLEHRFTDGACIIVSPEGHRSWDTEKGSLQPAEKGAGLLIHQLQRMIRTDKIPGAIILPVGMVYGSENPADNGLMIIGRPLSPAELIEKAAILRQESSGKHSSFGQASHALMIAIRDLLPPHMHGEYRTHSSLLQPVLADRVKLGVIDSRSKQVGLVWVED